MTKLGYHNSESPELTDTKFEIPYKQAKFDHSSFSHSGYMVGIPRNFNGSRNLPTPLSVLAAMNLLPIYQI